MELEPFAVDVPETMVKEDPLAGLDNEYDQKEVALFKCGHTPRVESDPGYFWGAMH